MSEKILFDSSVLIDEVRTGCHTDRIASVSGVVRNSSVVLAELWRGATGKAEINFLRTLEKNHPILTPTEKNWLESGLVLGKIRTDYGFTPPKLRDLHFDVLIALTTRSCGGWLITSNRSDFEMISSYFKVQLEFW
jgi:predicted nucleic acid-binding protein